ncbi:MAG: phage tail protein [Methylomonas sp.]|nr:MAG: phage tail protein [Methylomonas sp.]
MSLYRTKAGDVLDAICYKNYAGRIGATEAVLEANPGLADYGPILPAGVFIQLPVLPALQRASKLKLWD